MYELAGEWLRQHAREGDTLAAYEIGQVAYFSGLKTIDILGLTEPDGRPFIAKRDYAWAVRIYSPTYVFSPEKLDYPVTNKFFTSPEFALNYRPAARFAYRDDTDYVVYERNSPAPPVTEKRTQEAVWVDVYYPESMARSSGALYSLVIRNSSDSIWYREDDNRILVSYHWLNKEGKPVVWEGTRTQLPCDVKPGQSVIVSAGLSAPPKPGEYLLQWDLVRGKDDWLSKRGVIAEPKLATIR